MCWLEHAIPGAEDGGRLDGKRELEGYGLEAGEVAERRSGRGK